MLPDNELHCNFQAYIMNLQNHDISMYDSAFVAQAIDRRVAETGCGSPEAYTALLRRDSAEEEAFFASLHISYSAFFRNSLTFAVLEQIILPELMLTAREDRRREIRIWCAGCAAGQEPYSVAIMLEELMERSGQALDYRIFATDGIESQIAQAQTGSYVAEPLGQVSLKRLNRWFVQHGYEYTVVPQLARCINFSVFDLLSGATSSPPASIFGDFDLVMCCNLLYYYNIECRKTILNKLARCLGDTAFLVTGETERGFILENGYSEVYPNAAVFRRGRI
jgi:chemotaxis protein methyltransferase CheR